MATTVRPRPRTGGPARASARETSRDESREQQFDLLTATLIGDDVDVAGDGTAELVLEGWKFGGDTFLLFLQYTNGAWTELFRGRSNWCLDEGAR